MGFCLNHVWLRQEFSVLVLCFILFGSFHDGFACGCNSLIVSFYVKAFDLPVGTSSENMCARVRSIAEGALPSETVSSRYGLQNR